jgi:hypothetical protein
MASTVARLKALEAVTTDLRGEVQKLRAEVRVLEDLVASRQADAFIDRLVDGAEPDWAAAYEQACKARLEGARGGEA